MEELSEKIETALNEGRILILVAQVILGFEYQSVFQPGFDQLPPIARLIKLGGLGLMLMALTILMMPVPYHHLVERGQIRPSFLRFISRVMAPALLPFALSLGEGFFTVGTRMWDMTAGYIAGGVATAVALFFWYGLETMVTNKSKVALLPGEAGHETPLKEKIRCVLTEARMVLPGAQALLGFLFTAVLTQSFATLDDTTKGIHFGSLAVIALSSILLMAPAAYHRIVEQGENTERLCTFASRMVLWAMFFLALGIAGSVYVAVEKVMHSAGWALGTSIVTLLVFYGAWFGYMLLLRGQRQTGPLSASGQQQRYKQGVVNPR